MIHDELKQAREKYYATLNRLNLLFLRQHSFLKDKRLYEAQLQEVNALISKIQTKQRTSLQSNILAQDTYLRSLIKSNQQQIKNLQRKLEGMEVIQELTNLKSNRSKYQKMISGDFQSNIQQKLSMIRGKVDDLKKKIKQINKQILNYQQQHLQQIQDYSFQLHSLEVYKNKNQQLKSKIKELKDRKIK